MAKTQAVITNLRELSKRAAPYTQQDVAAQVRAEFRVLRAQLVKALEPQKGSLGIGTVASNVTIVQQSATLASIVPPDLGGTGVNNGTRTLSVLANSGGLSFNTANAVLAVPQSGTAALTNMSNRFSSSQTSFNLNGGTVSARHRIRLEKQENGSNVALDSALGELQFRGWRSGDYQFGAGITGQVDVAPSGTNVPTAIIFSTTKAGSTAAERMRLSSAGKLLVGDTSNADMSVGLTLNQGSNTDHILALKASFVAHGITTVAETDTYGFMRAINTTAGGVRLVGLRGSSGTSAALIQGYGYANDTTKANGSAAFVVCEGFLKSGTGVTAPAANANVWAVRSNDVTMCIVDAEGDIHVNGSSTLTSFDTVNDSHMVRALMYQSKRGSVYKDAFDELVRYNKEHLIEEGIISPQGFINVTRTLWLTLGATWQNYRENSITQQRIDALEHRMAALEGPTYEQKTIG